MRLHSIIKPCIGTALFLCIAAGVTQALQFDARSPAKFELSTAGGLYTLHAKDAKVADILAELKRLDVVDVQVDEKLDAKVTKELAGVSLEKLLTELSASQAFVYEKVGDTYKLTQATVTSQQAPVKQQAKVPGSSVARSLGKGVLTNTRKPVDEIMTRSSKAILLQNAVIDVEEALAGRPLGVPQALSASPDTEFYIVQFDHAVGKADRASLENAGAAVSHYVPNSAYAVRIEPGQVAAVRQQPGVAYVEPYHPYFKMSADVLSYVIGGASEESKALVESGKFNLMTFRGAEAETALAGMGVQVTGKQSIDGRDILTVACKPEQVQDLAKVDSVQWVEPSVAKKPMNDLGTKRIRASALKALHPTLNGEGVVINVTDTGVDFINPGFAINPNLPTSTNINTRIAYYESRVGAFTSDGLPGDNNGHGTHVAGSILGNGALSTTVSNSPGSTKPYSATHFAGSAPAARLVMLEDFNSFSDVEQAETAYEQGARISNNSWGNSLFEYGTLSAIWDALVRDADSTAAGNQAYIAFFAAGNAGDGEEDGTAGQPNTVGEPGNAKNVITVGAIEQLRLADNRININIVTGSNVVRTINSENQTDSDWQMAYFSSRGPVTPTDLRYKPDIVAPGSYVISIQSHETPSVDDYLDGELEADYRYGNVNSGTNFAFNSGTSMATPLSAGGGALIYQYFTNTFGHAPSPAIMKAMMVAGARMLHSLRYKFPVGFEVPDVIDQGFGVLDVQRAVDGPRIHDSDQVIVLDETDTTPVGTDEIFQQQVTLGADEGGLKIVLAWTDAAGTPGNSFQLVNDIDLIIQAPGGGGYLGNRFDLDGIHSARFPVPSPFLADGFNNVESVVIKDAPAGTYSVQVRGFQVPSGVQDFALVIMKGVGIEGRTRGDDPSIAIDSNDAPVIAYSDAALINGDFS
ncbi:MAG TPA: S8 family serine peptidase, partial [Kiritimatiellia bacterium]